MLKLTHTSQANPNVRKSFACVLQSIHLRLKQHALPLGLSALAMITLVQTGCSTRARILSNELSNNILVEYRDLVWSRRAYNLRYGNCKRPFGNHYRDGFCAGYMDICNGGDGYVPALPPSEYRGYEYQSPEGAKCVNTWFEGYPAGVAAAKQDRSGEFKDMFISKMINSAVTQDKAKHMLPGDVPIIKPKSGDTPQDNVTGSSNEAPPAPEVATGYPSTTPNYVTASGPLGTPATTPALIGPAETSQPTQHAAMSIVEPPRSMPTRSVRPALPPIVKAPARDNSDSSATTKSQQSRPMARTANASVITNQFVH